MQKTGSLAETRLTPGLDFIVIAKFLVRSRRLELPPLLQDSDLNAARLPVPPRPHCGLKYQLKPTRSRQLIGLFEPKKTPKFSTFKINRPKIY